ncbi:MAG TPA: dTDP-4-dehydrorhamnose 3,5-epimerase, partial [Steroidobacteraceae bacterium]|nr:dTDP-4-dehydrorhamnose 3,5-epimerase [Steroidobacteraceae bacterium]
QSYATAGIAATFVQDNLSHSQRWTLRGLHYQVQQPQGKLVRVIAGEVFDVAVDLRRSSPTFGRSVGVRLTAAGLHAIWVPPGFAHGFLALTEVAAVQYKVTDYRLPAAERVLAWNDPDLGIDWPLPSGVHPVLSDRDRNGRRLQEAETFA